jgi:hypothetical protein
VRRIRLAVISTSPKDERHKIIVQVKVAGVCSANVNNQKAAGGILPTLEKPGGCAAKRWKRAVSAGARQGVRERVSG